MRPTEVLRQEHRFIEHTLGFLVRTLSRNGNGRDIDGESGQRIVCFLRNYLESFHQRKEEDHFLPRLAFHGVRPNTGIVGVLLYEHGRARVCLNRLYSAVLDDSSCADLPDRVKAYVRFMIRHMRMEEEILFWMADEILTPDEQEIVEDGFDVIDMRSKDLLREVPLPRRTLPFAAAH